MLGVYIFLGRTMTNTNAQRIHTIIFDSAAFRSAPRKVSSYHVFVGFQNDLRPVDEEEA